MNITLWVVQILLALVFGMAGIMKVTQPIDKLEARMGWVKSVGPGAVRLIGSLEILGAIGLILPAVTGILPWLTPIAAACLALTMIGAMITHGRRGEYSQIGVNVVLVINIICSIRTFCYCSHKLMIDVVTSTFSGHLT